MVNKPARVGTVAYSCKTRAVRAGTRLSIAVEHHGDLLLTVTDSFFRLLRFRAEKNGKLVVPCAFSGISLSYCLPLRELGL